MGGRGVKSYLKLRDVIYGWTLRANADSFNCKYLEHFVRVNDELWNFLEAEATTQCFVALGVACVGAAEEVEIEEEN